jgi:hypothetical protein
LGFKRGIALREDATVAPPGVEIARFHVEHSAVEVSPPYARPPFYELVLLWVYHVDREAPRERLEPLLADAVDVDLKVASAETNAEGLGERVFDDFADDSQLRSALSEQISRMARAKRPPAAQQVDRFQETGLTGTVVAVEVASARS